MKLDQWQIYLLGRMYLRRGKVLIDHFRTRKTGSLLGLLALRPGIAWERDELASYFWPEEERNAGLHNLSVALSALRKQLEPFGTRDGSVLVTTRRSASLAAEAVSTDLGAFEAAFERAAASSPIDRGYDHVKQACALYGGPFLSGFHENWVRLERRRLAHAYAQLVDAYAELAERRGALHSPLETVLRALAWDPTSERLHQCAIRIHLRTGEPGAALQQYRVLERLLAADVLTVPAPATTELVRHLLPPSPPAVRAGTG